MVEGKDPEIYWETDDERILDVSKSQAFDGLILKLKAEWPPEALARLFEAVKNVETEEDDD